MAGPTVVPRDIPERKTISAIAAACAGNLVEWYDFYIYSYAAIYFSKSFFPDEDQTSQLLATAGILAIGYFMRPLGGWLLGRLADRRGRRTAMVTSMCVMSFGSLIIAVLPTHDMIGVLAPVLLLIARMLQGIAIGAEYGTGATYLSEIAPSKRRGLVGSLQYFTIISGQLFGLVTITVLQQVMSADSMRA